MPNFFPSLSFLLITSFIGKNITPMIQAQKIAEKNGSNIHTKKPLIMASVSMNDLFSSDAIIYESLLLQAKDEQ